MIGENQEPTRKKRCDEVQKKGLRNRYNILYILLFLMAVLIIQRLFLLQISEGENYREISDSRLARNIPVKAPRGEILDRYGRALVTNRVGHSIAIAKIDDDKQKLNEVVFHLASLFDAQGLSYEDSFPVSKEQPFEFLFSGETEEERQDKEKAFKKKYKFSMDMTATEMVEKFIARYQIADSYSKEEARKILGIRYEMEQRNFSSNNAYVFAKDVDIALVSQIKEQRDKYSCVSVYQEPIREYTNGSTAAHLLGRIGIINAEEYAELKDKNYGMNDYIGKEGAEKAFESYLKGTDGTNSIERKIKEGESEVVYSRDPVPGQTIMLTIDLDLQKAAEQALEKHIKRIASTSRPKNGADANAGAAVAIDLNSGELLAVANYPSFDPARYNLDYASLLQAPGNPLLNRALSGVYEPGSTFKLVTAIAGMESGNLSPTETMATKGRYTYLGHNFDCNIYRSSGGNHGTINVSQALRDSCNYFFYEVGRRTGIETIDYYAQMFGLGDYTGIELGEEVRGKLASPEERKESGREWYPGDVLQASIGQSDNLFTPLQIANYVATVANGGTNYKAHLLKAVRTDAETGEYMEIQPEVRHKVELKRETLEAVLQGMGLVTAPGGTASSVFGDFPLKTGGKTGSAQVSSGSANGIYVGFAPFDDPQIAVAVVVEHGASGSGIAPIARDIFEQYFYGHAEVSEGSEPKNELLP